MTPPMEERTEVRVINLFVSSSKDVIPEREAVQRIADRLSGEFSERLRFNTIRWEEDVYSADASFQHHIIQAAEPADCDVVIGIFRGRIGTPLHKSFDKRQKNGAPFPSGTGYEILSALEAREENGRKPDVYVFRKEVGFLTITQEDEASEESRLQREGLKRFMQEHFETPDGQVLRATEWFSQISEFETKIEKVLRKWIRDNVPQEAVWSIEDKGSPFRGLEPFDARHADVFFGRSRKLNRAVETLKEAAERGKPFLLIPGASGSGKSSLMRAGIAPRLVRPGIVPGVDLWRVAIMRPGTHGGPLQALANALFVEGTPDDDPGGFGRALPELKDFWSTPERLAAAMNSAGDGGADALIGVLDRISLVEQRRIKRDQPPRVNLLLLVDQLEDVFSSDITDERRVRFAEVLQSLVMTQRVWIVSTLRADMFERMITERPFITLKDRGGQYDLSPPGAEELDEIVHRSAAAAGLTYEDRIVTDAAGASYHERLDDLLLRDAEGENTLPLLQFALNLLFEACWGRRRSKKLTLDAYREFGGLDGAIHQTAETALAKLVRPEADVHFPMDVELKNEISKTVDGKLEALLLKLVAPVDQLSESDAASGNRPFTARILRLKDARQDDATIARLIDVLMKARILNATGLTGDATLRIAHDRVIVSWERARNLTERNQDFYRVRDDVEKALDRYEENGRRYSYLLQAGEPVTRAEAKLKQFPDEFSDAATRFIKRSGTKARLLLRGTQLAVLVLMGLSGYAIWQRNQAVANEGRAVANEARAVDSYEAARDTVGRLVRGIVKQLRDTDDVQNATIEKAFHEVSPLIDNLVAQSDDDPELMRIRAETQYEFAVTYQNARNLKSALEQADQSLAIRESLQKRDDAREEWQEDLAASLDKVGDVQRAMAQNMERAAKGPTPESKQKFETARRRFEASLALRTKMLESKAEDCPRGFALCQSLVRLGDVQIDHDKDYDKAKATYRKALDTIVGVLKRQPEEPRWVRELSWCFKKNGDVERDKKGDRKAQRTNRERSLVARRYLASKDPSNTLWRRDQAFAADDAAKTRTPEESDDAALLLTEALLIRRELVSHDSGKMLWLNELAMSLESIAGHLDARGLKLEAAGFYGELADTLENYAAHVEREAEAVRKRAQATHAKRDAALAAAGKEAGVDVDLATARETAKRWQTRMIERYRKERVDPSADWNRLLAELENREAESVARQIAN